jgi:hypothetical protein
VPKRFDFSIFQLKRAYEMFEKIEDDMVEWAKKNPYIEEPGSPPCGICVVIVIKGEVIKYWHADGYWCGFDENRAEMPYLYKRWAAAEKRCKDIIAGNMVLEL